MTDPARYVDFAMHRVRMLIHFGIKPYLVFDGDYLPSKAGTEAERASRRAESKKLGLDLLKAGKVAQAQQELQKSIDVTPEMARLLIEELKKSKVAYIVAPYEADSQMAYLEKKGIINGIISEDSDLLVFGARCLITKLDQYGECVAIRRDHFTACREVSLVGWTDADFRRMAILSGCDYLPGLSGLGLKTAHRMMRKHKTVERVVRQIQFDGKSRVPPDYLESFKNAELTFLHPWVFCPETQRLVHLTELEPGINVVDMPFIGKHVPSITAIAVAQGELHPHTKAPIAVQTLPPRAPPRRWPTQKENVAATPDTKKNHSIDTFFKARRTPLAELDPNSFTPSPSQQRLLQRGSTAFTSIATPENENAPTARTSSVSQPPRRTVSESFASRGMATSPAKRRRLCSDNPANTQNASNVLSGRSKFFAPATAEPSPSTRAEPRRRRQGKEDFTVFSDDSVEDAMAELVEVPDLDDLKAAQHCKKVAIFNDMPESQPAWPQAAAPETQSTSTAKHSFVSSVFDTQDRTIESQTTCDDYVEEPSPFDEALRQRTESFQERFSFQELDASATSPPKPTPLQRASTTPLLLDVLFPAAAAKLPKTTRERRIEIPTSEAPGSVALLLDVAGTASATVQSVNAGSPVRERERFASLEPVEALPRSPATGLLDLPSRNEPTHNDMIPDEAFRTMEDEIVVAASSPVAAKEQPVMSRTVVGGSEDLLISDSEGSVAGESPPVARAKIDLARFAYVARC